MRSTQPTTSERAITYPIGVTELARKIGKAPRTARGVAARLGIGSVIAGRRIIRTAAEKNRLLRNIREVCGNPNFGTRKELGETTKLLGGIREK